MLFKVYAQCCKVARPVEQVDSINEAIWENIYNLMDAGRLGNYDDEDKVDEDISKAWDKLVAKFNRDGIILVGDYQIVKAPHRSNVHRPAMCGWETL